jgi:hypothetical protein
MNQLFKKLDFARAAQKANEIWRKNNNLPRAYVEHLRSMLYESRTYSNVSKGAFYDRALPEVIRIVEENVTEPAKKILSVRVTLSDFEMLQRQANAESRTIASLVRQIISEHLNG